MYKQALIFELKTRQNELGELINEINVSLNKYRKGSLVIQNDYAYIKHYENGKMISTYVGKHLSEKEIEDLKRELKNRKTLEKRNKEYRKEYNELTKLIAKYGGQYGH